MIKESTYFTELLEESKRKGYEEGVRIGMLQAIHKGKRLAIIRTLSNKLGKIPYLLENLILLLDNQDLDLLVADSLNFQSLEDLRLWLDRIEYLNEDLCESIHSSE